MFNYLVSASEDDWSGKPVILPSSRFLEFTPDDLKARYSALNDASISTLTQIPALFAFEVGIGKSARVGRITTIQEKNSSIRLSYEFDRDVQPVTPNELADLVWDLDLDGWETNRTHWALKKPDLMKVLNEYRQHSKQTSTSGPQLIRFGRGLLLSAADMLRTLGHTSFDRFLLEIGIPEIDAGRSKGGLMDRATALGKFVVEHQEMSTADGVPLGMLVVQKAAQADPRYPDGSLYGGDERVRKAFWNGLAAEGFGFDGDAIVSSVLDQGRSTPRTQSNIPRSAVGGDHMATPATSSKVFLVHGRDGGSKEQVARFIERLDLEVVILHERPSSGRSLISKFFEEAADIGFAVVLITPDDEGGIVGGRMSKRGRQNVIFELGYFIGKLGPSKVCALVSPEVERPSDFEAVVYIAFGENNNWKMELMRELRHAGLTFDPSRGL